MGETKVGKQTGMAEVVTAFLEIAVRLVRLGELDAAREAIAQAVAALRRLPRTKGGR
jgi:hypothetical protein